MKIAIGSDHAGFQYKGTLTKWLEAHGHTIKDLGTYTSDAADYADFAHPVARRVEEGEAELGVLICGSANGVAITANKHQGIRAAICWTEELASLARRHNDANILCLPARFVSLEQAESILDTFLHTVFEEGRHRTRIGKISC
jgi:ribose 5-phosphate isomerase B